MTPAVRSMVSATYVRDIDIARAFYELLGFGEHSAGRAPTSAWSVMQHEELSVLLTSTRPPLDIPRLPLLFYFFYEDLEVVVRRLEVADVPMDRTGHPPHALGGEVKVLDPDGNTVLLGQRERSASQPPSACEVPNPGHRRCPNRAEVKLADSGGDVAWVCLTHADEILMTVPAAFIASQGEPGIVGFLSSRR